MTRSSFLHHCKLPKTHKTRNSQVDALLCGRAAITHTIWHDRQLVVQSCSLHTARVFREYDCEQWCSGAWRSGYTLNLWPQFFLPARQRMNDLCHKQWHVKLVLHISFTLKCASNMCTLSLNVCCLSRDHYENNIIQSRSRFCSK